MDDKQKNGNQGIIANSVVADVLVVGKNATATKTVISHSEKNEVISTLNKLMEQIQSNTLEATRMKILVDDLNHLKQNIEGPSQDSSTVTTLMKSFIDKLHFIKESLSNSKDIIESVKTIAGMLKIPIALLGL